MASGNRGIRNNNPGNIDFNPRNDWQGQLGYELSVAKPRFARFDSPENGIRAMAKLLINYRGKDGIPEVGGKGIDTVRETISRWAPGVENDTESYITSVACAVGVEPNQPIEIRSRDVLLAVANAIIRRENGGNPYASSIVTEGVRRALS